MPTCHENRCHFMPYMKRIYKNVANIDAIFSFYIVLLWFYQAVDLSLATLVPEYTVTTCAVSNGLNTRIVVVFRLFHRY